MKLFGLVALALNLASATLATPPQYAVSGSIAASDGGWDYASFDPETNQLYVARTDGVLALNLANGMVIERLATAQSAHAVLPIPGMGALLETDSKTDSVRLIDAKTGVVRWSLKTGAKPDGALWDAVRHRAIIINNGGGTISLVDVAAVKVTGEIKLTPSLEMAALDKRGMLWVNNEKANTVTPIDLITLKAQKPIQLPGCDGPTGLVYTPRQDALIVACGNGMTLVVSADKRRVTAHYTIGKRADYALADVAHGLVAIPCGEGVLEFFDISGSVVRHSYTLKTEQGARTGAIDLRTGIIYLPAARFAPPQKLGERPKALPGSFHILIISPL